MVKEAPAVKPAKRALFVLCPDISWRSVLEAILARYQSLGLPHALDVEVTHIPGKTDGGVRKSGPSILRSQTETFERALLVIDHEGCGDARDPAFIERDLDEELSKEWGDRAKAIVVAPELEAWIVGAHRHFNKIRGLEGVEPLHFWRSRGLWPEHEVKPKNPKEAIECLFDAHDAKRSSASYRKIAEHGSLDRERCRSASYHTFFDTMRRWFGN